ncbi:MAG TPA: response regulator [Acidimicrobiales bacterium]|nr:response regulator [Acidimicrobiales bacterium]
MARILIVDDEPDILLMLRMGLEDEGHDVFMAADGEMALARIAEHSPDLVVLDLMMPVLDGYGVLERLQADGGSAMPVVVVSAKAESADIDRALGLGAREFVSKPFDLDRLVALVASTLGA